MKELKMTYPKIAVLIPARNEEKSIEESIKSIFRSSYPIDQVIVISDNSTDKTVEVVDSLRARFVKLKVIRTKNNKARKAGALNRAIRQFCTDSKYIMVLDADTRVDTECIKEGIRLLEKDPQIGGICARTHVAPIKGSENKNVPPDKEITQKIILSKIDPSKEVTQKIRVAKPTPIHDDVTKKIVLEKANEPKTKITLGQKIWWQIQRLEYATADSNRVENLERIQILAGSNVIYRMEALKQVAIKRGNGQFYDESSLIEDYELTIMLKELGWKTTIGLKMHAWTDVPLNLKTHWQQRIRWARSHIDTLREKGWNKITKADILGHIMFVIIFPQQIFFLGLLVYLLTTNTHIVWNPLLWSILGVNWVSRMYRLKYLPDLKFSDILVRAMFIPEELYGIYQSVQRVYSYWLAFTHGPEVWHET
jgi:cellulose synthase/poly-beta-1,6-N-acetylglucosamine synthase-like glycosyltransferase